jgi:hypothetical protein
MSDSPPYPLLGGPWLIGGAQYMLSDEGGRAGDQRLQLLSRWDSISQMIPLGPVHLTTQTGSRRPDGS